MLDDLLESPLLPLLENTFRGCTMIDMTKHPDLNHSYFQLMRTIASHKTLLPSLIEIDTQYKPA